jgi:hypothetical protein
MTAAVYLAQRHACGSPRPLESDTAIGFARTRLTMIFLQANWIIAFVCAFMLYGAGKAEAREAGRNAGALWAGLSIAVSAVLIRFLGAGWFSVLVGQAALFVGIGVFRAMRSK